MAYAEELSAERHIRRDNKMGQYTKIEADANAPKLFVRSP